MNNSILIYRIVSLYLIVTGTGFLVPPSFYTNMIAHTGTDPILINLSGMVHFFIGMTILVFHFKWRGLLQILASAMGVLFLLKGIMLIAIPDLTLQTGNNDAQVPRIMGLVFISTGSIMTYLSSFKNAKYQ